MLVNITPHTLNIHTPSGEVLNIAPSGTVARVTTTEAVVGEVAGIPVTATTFGEVVDLPAPQEGMAFVASLLVASAARRAGRTDVFSPGPLVRDAGGQPVGCRGLSAPG